MSSMNTFFVNTVLKSMLDFLSMSVMSIDVAKYFIEKLTTDRNSHI